MTNNFSDRLNKLFNIRKTRYNQVDINKYREVAESECISWINKFSELELIPKNIINKIDIITDSKYIPDSAKNVIGQFRGSIVNNESRYQIIVNVDYSIIEQNSWYNIYDSIEKFLGNIALHEVCHLIAFLNGSQFRGELAHGVTWQKYYLKYRNLYTEVPLKVSKDGLYTNFNKTRFNELEEDCIIEFITSDNIKDI